MTCEYIYLRIKNLRKYNWTVSDGNLSAYDIKSIMHYDGTLRGRFTDPIIVDNLTGKGIEVNRNMSALDIQKLNEMYPCKPTGPAFGKFVHAFLVFIDITKN